MLVIEYTPTFSRIHGLRGEDSTHLKHLISSRCSYQVKNAQYTDAAARGKWDGWIRLFHRGTCIFPSGLLSRVEEVLKEEEVEYELSGFDFPDMLGSDDLEDYDWLRDYQLKGILEAYEAGRGIIHFPTGSGKSKLIVGLLSMIGRTGICIVHRKELMDQMVEHLEERFDKVGIIQGGNSMKRHDYKGWDCDVYVAMTQTLCNHAPKNDDDTSEKAQLFRNMTEKIEVMCIDEVQRSGAKRYYNMVQQFTSTPYRYGLSATIKGRSDGADMLLEAATGEVVTRVTETDLMKQGWISKPKIYMFPVNAFHASRHEWSDIYREGIVENEERNTLIADALLELLKAGKQGIVLCQYIAHGMGLLEAINNRVTEWNKDAPAGRKFPNVAFIHGSSGDWHRKGEIEKMRRAETLCLILSSIGDEGLDIPDIDFVVIASAGKSQIKALQRVGRALRKKESGHAIVVDFIDNDQGSGKLCQHSFSRVNAYESREFEVYEVSGMDEFVADIQEY